MMRPPDENPLSATLIIPQYNQPELTVQAIESLRRHDSHHWPIVVVANGCSPHSIRQLHQIQDSRAARTFWFF
jgi:FMN phosphatase YigB (HAD superfamily)